MLRARRRHRLGRFHDLPLGFHRARPRHHDELVAADLHPVDPHLGALFPELLADELVGRGDAHGALHPRRGFQRFQAGRDVAHAHHADDAALFAFDGMNSIAELPDPFANVVDLRLVACGRMEMIIVYPSYKTKKPTLSSGLAFRTGGDLNQRHSRLRAKAPEAVPKRVGVVGNHETVV